MRKLVIIIFFAPIYVWGQCRHEVKADKFFQFSAFEEAIIKYKFCLEKNLGDYNIMLKIARCYLELHDFKKAEKWYNEAFFVNENVDPQYKYNYAYCLYINGKHKEAEKWFLNYSNSIIGADRRVQKFLQSINTYNKYFIDTSFVFLYNLNINSKKSDFPATIIDDELGFVSNKSIVTKKNYNSPFNIYFTKKDLNMGDFFPKSKIKKALRAQYHSGPLVFYNNYENIIVSHTCSQLPAKDNKSYYTLQLYEGGFNKEQRKISYLNKIQFFDATVSHPAVNEAGTILIFSSDVNRDKSGMDLFMVEKKDSMWGVPKNLGNMINTKGNEMFPYLFNDSILYFSSNGHGGLGGHDILRVNLNQTDLEVENLGSPINSTYDDFSIILKPNGMDGYFASNRPGGKGDDDIYSFETIKVRFKGLVKNNENDKPIGNAKLIVYTSGGDSISTFSDSLGKFEVIVNPKEDVKLELYAQNYIENKEFYSNPTAHNTIFYLEPEAKIEKAIIEIQKPMLARKEPVFKLKDVQGKSVRVLYEIVDPVENKVLSTYLVPDLWINKEVWGTMVVEVSE